MAWQAEIVIAAKLLGQKSASLQAVAAIEKDLLAAEMIVVGTG